MARNWNCDGNTRNKCDMGEVRVYPTGGDSNMIYCRHCFEHENRYNRNRVAEGNVDPKNFPQQNWDKAKIYDTNNSWLDPITPECDSSCSDPDCPYIH